MIFRSATRSMFIFIAVTAAVAQLFAQADASRGNFSSKNRVDVTSAWKTETLRRKDGRVFRGLVQSQSNDHVAFVEIKREDSKQLYLVIHHYQRKAIEKITRLSKVERAELYNRIQPLLEKKSHARIEAGRMEDVTLNEQAVDGQVHFDYRGDLFSVKSGAADEITRRCIVRLEQIFRAYQQVLPPRSKRADLLMIHLHGSMDEYRNDLQQRDLQILNPAFYSTERNLIVAGSELTRYGQQLAQIRQKNDRLRRDYKQMDRDFRKQLDQLRIQLKQNRFTDKQITLELRLRNAKWKADNKVDGEYWEMLRKISTVDRMNEAMFNDVTRTMFRRLFHESFHAYLENYVFPHRSTNVPRWLNEGLAQIFENSVLDGDTLRIDAPNRELLEALQGDLRRRDRLSVEQLLRTQDQAFLISHDAVTVSQRQYLYSWGLAYYLTFYKDILNDDGLADYVGMKHAKKSPITRFEKLVGVPLDRFEREWREYVLILRPAPQR